MVDRDAAEVAHLPQLDARFIRQPARIIAPLQRPAAQPTFLPELPKNNATPTSSSPADPTRPHGARQHRPRPHTDQPKQFRQSWANSSRGSRSNTSSPLKPSSPNFKEHRTKRRDMLRQALALLGAEPATPADEQSLEVSRCSRLESNARLAVEMAEAAARKDLAQTFQGVTLKLRRAHRASTCAPTTPATTTATATDFNATHLVPPPTLGLAEASLTVGAAHVAALNAIMMAEEPCRLGVVAAEKAARKTLQLFMTAGNPAPPPTPPGPRRGQPEPPKVPKTPASAWGRPPVTTAVGIAALHAPAAIAVTGRGGEGKSALRRALVRVLAKDLALLQHQELALRRSAVEKEAAERHRLAFKLYRLALEVAGISPEDERRLLEEEEAVARRGLVAQQDTALVTAWWAWHNTYHRSIRPENSPR